MYLIIVGAGDFGTPLIGIATKSGNDVVVIEQDEERANLAADRFDCMVLEADATEQSTLAEAGAGTADGIISTTDQDATNIMVSLLAGKFGVESVLSVVHNPEHMDLFREIGVNTMQNPQELIAEYLYRSVARPAIVDYMRIGEDAEVFEIRVTESAPVAGMTIAEAAEADVFPEEVLVVAIEREDRDHTVTPKGDTEIHVGDLLTVYSGVGADPEITDLFGHYEDDTT
ncbi:MAG: TrkA family potassium uptake protein [Halanaeroarchaeum sp.]